MNPSDIASTLLTHLLRFFHAISKYVFYFSRLNFASSRAAANNADRTVDPADSVTWEFSGFSQNGEDGIIDFLSTLIREPNRYFIEIGAADGLENNSAYLALVRKYNGLMVEGNRFKSVFARSLLQPQCLGVEFRDLYVNARTAPQLVESARHSDPDFFSLDIDGIDYYVAESLFTSGLRPKIACVEYNSAFGPELSVTIPFHSEFDFSRAHPTRLYYGVSLSGWQTFFRQRGYEFVTVDSNGVNAFFVDPDAVESDELRDIQRLDWRENCSQWARFHLDWRGQYELIKEMPLETIGA